MKQKALAALIFALLSINAWSQEYKYNIEKKFDNFTKSQNYTGSLFWQGFEYTRSVINEDTTYSLGIRVGLNFVSFQMDTFAHFLFKDGVVRVIPVEVLVSTSVSAYGTGRTYTVYFDFKAKDLNFYLENEIVGVKYGLIQNETIKGKKLIEILKYLRTLNH